jgi:hypothetical protein
LSVVGFADFLGKAMPQSFFPPKLAESGATAYNANFPSHYDFSGVVAEDDSSLFTHHPSLALRGLFPNWLTNNSM